MSLSSDVKKQSKMRDVAQYLDEGDKHWVRYIINVDRAHEIIKDCDAADFFKMDSVNIEPEIDAEPEDIPPMTNCELTITGRLDKMDEEAMRLISSKGRNKVWVLQTIPYEDNQKEFHIIAEIKRSISIGKVAEPKGFLTDYE